MPFFLLFFPLVFFAADRWFLLERGPYFWNANLDPDYAYLFNGLEIIHRRVPGHVDHPGTPVQVLNGIVIYVMHFFSCLGRSCLSTDRSVFTDPEFYLHGINFVLILMIAASVYFFGLRVYRVTGNKVRALTAQFFLLLFPSVLFALPECRPEPLFLAAAICLMAILFDERIQGKAGHKSSLSVGALLGFGLATKVVFLPLVLFAFVFKKRSQVASCLGALVLSAIFFTLPIITVYPHVFRWFGSVATHTGIYGGGDVGIPGVVQLWANFVRLTTAEPFFFINLFGLGLILISVYSSRLVFLCVAVAAVQALITIKHPGGHYLLPSMPVLVLANIKVLEHFGAKETAKKVFGVLLLVGVLLIGSQLYDWRNWAQRVRKETEHMTTVLANQPCKVVYYQGGMGKLYALNFGNWFTTALGAYNYSWILREEFPQGLTVEEPDVTFFSAKLGKEPLQKMISGENCMVINGRKILPEQEKSFGRFHLKPVETGEFFGIYRVGEF